MLFKNLNISASIISRTVDSTGDTKNGYGSWNNGGPKTYTLTAGETSIDLSQKNLGSADVTLLVAWVQRPNVIASLTSCCLLHNPLGEGVKDIINVFEQTPRLRTLCGFEEGSEEVDLSRTKRAV